MPTETIDTNCMTLTRWILGEQKKYAPPGQSGRLTASCRVEEIRFSWPVR